MDADIYVLAKTRRSETASLFLEKYLPQRSFNDGEYKFYSYDKDEELECDNEIQMLKLIETKKNLVLNCAFYPKRNEPFIRNVQLYYLEDGGMICCLNIIQDDKKEDDLLNELKGLLKSEYGFVSYHIPPPNTKVDFIKTANELK